jgi:hypothetical protein
MSVGAWTLVGVGSAVSAATFTGLMRERYGPSFSDMHPEFRRRSKVG